MAATAKKGVGAHGRGGATVAKTRGRRMLESGQGPGDSPPDLPQARAGKWVGQHGC